MFEPKSKTFYTLQTLKTQLSSGIMMTKALIFASFLSVQIFAQTGKDGSLTVASGTVTVNKYFPVSGNISSGSNTINLAVTATSGLCPGDLIMIYQAQGASINTANTNAYGNVLNYNSAGLYEFKYVQSVNGNQLITQGTMTNSYASSGRVQVVKVPQFTSLTINPGAVLQAKAWKDTTIASVLYRFGGLLVVHSTNIVNNGTVSASGKGFRGGQINNNGTFINGLSDYVSNNIFNGGEKGEGLFGYYQEYDLSGGRYCRGAAANGGGGGTSTNASGGGGANGFNGNTWTGQGVMVVNGSNPLAAWVLDPGYVVNGNALTNSSGGGRGGYSWSDWNMNALMQGPGNFSWGGDDRREVGGIGGRPLNNINSENRIYFGGGGGAGHQNNDGATSGGSGGGIIFLYAKSGISGNGIIESSGKSVPTSTGCSCDGLGGGGGGGSIVIKSGTLAPTQTIVAEGGKGGDQLINNFPASQPTESQGPGGGGGGGFIAVSSGSVVPNISGGMNGSSQGSGVTEFSFNGATKGGAGQTGTVSGNFVSFIPFSIAANNNSPVCMNAILSFSTGQQNAMYSWTGPNNFVSAQQNPTLLASNQNMSGTYTLNISMPGCPPHASTTTVVFVSICEGLWENSTGPRGYSVYPNPNSGEFSVEIKQAVQNPSIEIYNLLGEKIFYSELSDQTQRLDIKKYPKGIYLYRILDEKNVLGQGKLIKE
jgi:hypothetical protein